jgi:ribosomal-protein-alanine N-acetyltransferase
MSEAVQTFVAYCFKNLDTQRAEAMIQPENVASIRLAERLGFRREGVLRDRRLVDGSYRTVAMYALLANEFRES